IPPGKLSPFLVMPAKRISKAPTFDFVERSPFGLAAHDSFLPQLGIVHVSIFRRHVEVAAEDDWGTNLKVVVKKRAQTFHPIKFELKLLRADRLPIRYVDIHDLNAIDPGGQETRMRSFLILVVSATHFRAFLPRQNRNAVVTLLSEDTGAVADLRKLIERKLVVRAFRLLHAKHVGLDRFEPAKHMRQASDD